MSSTPLRPSSDAVTAPRALFFAHWQEQGSLTAAALLTARQTGDAIFAVNEALDPRHQIRGDLPLPRRAAASDLDTPAIREATQMAVALLVDDILNNRRHGVLHAIASKAQHLMADMERLQAEQCATRERADPTLAADTAVTRACLRDLVARARVIKEQRAFTAALARRPRHDPVEGVTVLAAVLPDVQAELAAFDALIDRGIPLHQALDEDLAIEAQRHERPAEVATTDPRPTPVGRRP